MSLVAWYSYRASKDSTSDSSGYFLAGRGLSAPFIAGSLLLTNLSAEQLIGLNGSAYGYNMSSMAWEVTAAVATIAMAFSSYRDISAAALPHCRSIWRIAMTMMYGGLASFYFFWVMAS